MKKSNQKSKILFLMKILLEYTDENHPMSAPDMIAELSRAGISAERKSIYDDIECLRVFGIDVCYRKSEPSGYFIGNRDFELPELKLLVDIIQASKFITHKKSMELIEKIEKLTSKHYAKQLHRQVIVTNRAKTLNEKIFYNVDKIHNAISANSQITFKYFDIDIRKNRIYRKNGERYTESPVSLMWDDENYYLITYKAQYDNYVHYRVDKMEDIKLTEVKRNLPDKPFDPPQYAKSMFHMFNGKETDVSIRFANELAGVVYDRFGMDIPIVENDEKHFICTVKAAISPHFLSWITAFGDKAEIISPDYVRDELLRLIETVKRKYD